MKQHPIDVFSIASALIGFSALVVDAGFKSEVTALAGAAAPQVLAVIGLLGPVGIALRTVYNPTAPSATPANPTAATTENPVAPPHG
jgi:hypothetical protein